MFGSIEEWFYRSLSGINPGAPGFEKIIIKPQPAGDLTWVKGSYNSERGLIKSNWKKDATNFSLDVSIPVNTMAEVWIPAKNNATITDGDKPVKTVRYENGYAIVVTGSGNYSFTASNK